MSIPHGRCVNHFLTHIPGRIDKRCRWRSIAEGGTWPIMLRTLCRSHILSMRPRTPHVSGLRLEKTPRKGGFTLIEMMISIVVVGILASVLLFGYTQWRAKAWRAVLFSDVRSFAIAEELRRANPVASGAVDSTAVVFLSSDVTLFQRLSRPQEWQIVVRHEGTDQNCWGRWSTLSSPPLGMRVGCGPLPSDSTLLAVPIDTTSLIPEVITPLLTITGPG